MTKKLGKIAIMTGGGDCPGLNAAIRAVVKTAHFEMGSRAIGLLDGFEGLMYGKFRDLGLNDVANILNSGGTILGSSNKASLYHPEDVSDVALENLKKWNIDALFCVGGDGTLSIAGKFLDKFPRIIGIPKTIDNDLKCTDLTIGFDTACSFVTEALDRLHYTAESHHRVMVVEVMGRYAGWLALNGGLAGGGDIILIPEMPFSFDKVVKAVEKRRHAGKRSSIVVVSEGARPKGEDYTVSSVVKDSPDPIRLGGIAKRVSDVIEESLGCESRVTVLGHLQRGGAPSFLDRMLATNLGAHAVHLAARGEFGRLVVYKNGVIRDDELKASVSGLKLVEEGSDLVKRARSVGVEFGV